MKNLFTFFMGFFILQSVQGQTPGPYTWWNPFKNKLHVIEGQAWPTEAKEPYDRLPARAEGKVTPSVWNLSKQTAGLAIRFRTAASEIVVRYTVSREFAMPHMPSTGVSGVDLYAIDADGGWKWAAGKYQFGDTITFRYPALTGAAREYRLYFPLYNQVTWMEIGVPEKDSISPLPIRSEKPIVVYGTSIAQGACASRPGLAWTSLLDRELDRPVINLGFSGNGKLAPAVIDLLSEIDAKVLVLDCLPNISGLSRDTIRQLIVNAVIRLRQKRPDIPILLTAAGSASLPLVNEGSSKNHANANLALMMATEELQANGIRQVYVLPAEDLKFDVSSTVDGVHPGDAGMVAYAKAYAGKLRSILHEVSGSINTTIPCRQYREYPGYDWDARHREVLLLNKQSPPDLVMIGNSITHYWGGEPKAQISRGQDSWDDVLAPLGARNFGFGWDRIENVLWRVYHDELDGYEAKNILIMIGTNNLAGNTDKEIIQGLDTLLTAIRQRQPYARILLSGIYPRSKMEDRVKGLNQLINVLSNNHDVQYINPGKQLLKADGTIEDSLFTDGLHPNKEGYRKLASFLKATVFN